MNGKIHIGIGGWTYEPWRGVFYPEKLSQKKELEFASRALTSIEQECGVKRYRRRSPPNRYFSATML